MAETDPEKYMAKPIDTARPTGAEGDPGLTAAEYAAIHLCVTSEHVPEWLNEMVRERQRMDAEQAFSRNVPLEGGEMQSIEDAIK